MNTPTIQQRKTLAADHARRYEEIQKQADRDVQRLNVLLGRTSRSEHAANRADPFAHISQGYRPEPVQPTLEEESRPLNYLICAVWFLFGAAAWAVYLYFAFGVQS